MASIIKVDQIQTAAGGTPTAADLGIVPIAEYDQWRLTTTQTNSGGADVTSGWERNDFNFEKIGTGMTEASGIFTFPSTGKWLVLHTAQYYATTDTHYIGIRLFLSTNAGSSYTKVTESYTNIYSGGSVKYGTSAGAVGFDVTSATDFKLQVNFLSQVTGTLDASTTEQRTGLTFIKYGTT